jgi:hypothetical protein
MRFSEVSRATKHALSPTINIADLKLYLKEEDEIVSRTTSV